MNIDQFVDQMDRNILMSASVLVKELVENTQKVDVWEIVLDVKGLCNWLVLNRELLLIMLVTYYVLVKN